MSVSNKGPGVDSRLQNLTNALYLDLNNDVVVRTGFAGNIVITGNVNVPSTVQVFSNIGNAIHTHITEVGGANLVALGWSFVPIAGNVSLDAGTNMIGNVKISQMPAISGNVTATIADVITVIVDESAGNTFAFNNHAAAVHRGWVMDDTMRPVVSVQIRSGFTAADLVKIIEYEIGNNNANQSTIMYEWYEGPLTISGAALPGWTNVGTKLQYRVYQDVYSSNQGNTFTIPAGTYQRHSGIIIGKNTTNDEAPVTLSGGDSPNILTLCMKRLDNGTKLDVWFAFTFKELA
jgi:hypothetical protein